MDDMIRNRDRSFDDNANRVSDGYLRTNGEGRLSWPMLRRAEFEATSADQASRGAAAQSAFDMLRTKIAATMQANSWSTLAVTAPTAGCGTTTLAVALATGLARQRDTRVTLLDLNLRRPGVARMLGLKGQFDIADFLNGVASTEDAVVRRGDKLAIVPNTSSMADPTEVLHSASVAAAVETVQQDLAPRFIIFDLPPMLEHDDLLGFLPFVDCVLLVLGAEQSSLGQADACERELSGRNKLLGVVLNKCRLGLGEFDV
ncbi:CpsD/CapB family tyrosine-protein kinase [Devosia sp. Leaf64]|uniref:CpsD/CapB family tyrosine-protein kinase n=1 Tax=Devosia sp. Leaf64 TaxID=1736229 RepID=UPI000787E1AD|nr:CpsD/CapB family tyrosine-protein kinase [Devosia sp. Leaf64]